MTSEHAALGVSYTNTLTGEQSVNDTIVVKGNGKQLLKSLEDNPDQSWRPSPSPVPQQQRQQQQQGWDAVDESGSVGGYGNYDVLIVGVNDDAVERLSLASGVSLSEEPILCCTVCRYRTQAEVNLVAHAQTHRLATCDTKRKALKCRLCTYSSSLVAEFKQHASTHVIARPYQCRYCPRTFKVRSLALRHTRKRHAENSIKIKMADDTINAKLSKSCLHPQLRLSDVMKKTVLQLHHFMLEQNIQEIHQS